jgi:hypothetical protein
VVEHDEEPAAAPRYRQLKHLGGLVPLLEEIAAGRP